MSERKLKLSEQITNRMNHPYLPAPGEFEALCKGWCARAATLESIVEKLPVTKDGKVVVPGRDVVWARECDQIIGTDALDYDGREWLADFHLTSQSLHCVCVCYSSRAACQAAEGKGG